MGLTITNTNRRALGNEFEVNCDAVFNAVYTTGGVAIIPEDLGLLSILRLSAFPKSGFVFEWVPSTAKLKVYRSGAVATHAHDLKLIGGTTATEPVADGPDGITLGKAASIDRTIAGANSATKGGVMADGAVAQVALAEITNGVDLSTTPGSFIIIARGR